MLYRQPRVNLVAIILLLLGGAYHLRASSDYESQIQSALTAMYTYKFALECYYRLYYERLASQITFIRAPEQSAWKAGVNFNQRRIISSNL